MQTGVCCLGYAVFGDRVGAEVGARDAEDGDEFAGAGDADLVDEGFDGAPARDGIAVGDELKSRADLVAGWWLQPG